MTNTISEFLEELKAKGIQQIAERDSEIEHNVTIGNMFEGLTAELLSKSIFRGYNLKIVNNSFIYNDNEKLSKEMDCMIVVGDGEKISFTNQYKYHFKNVIAVIQVKKTINKKALIDSHDNLTSVIDTFEPSDGEMYMRKIQADSYKLLVGKVLPTRSEIKEKSWREQMFYHYLLMQAYWPIRILIGYQGYKTEYGLREGFVKIIEEKVIDGPIKGYSPITFPDLIICGKNSIIKNIGMPFGYPSNNNSDFYWEILQSSNNRPMYLALEMIWTRLSYKFNIGSVIFGDDFELNCFHRFLSCRHKKIEEEKYAWEYNYYELNKSKLSEPLSSIEWKPIELNEIETPILFSLIYSSKKVIDNSLIEYLNSKNTTIEDFINNLTKKRIAYREKNEIILLIESPIISFGKDGKQYIGENKSGEMSNWIMKQASI